MEETVTFMAANNNNASNEKCTTQELYSSVKQSEDCKAFSSPNTSTGKDTNGLMIDCTGSLLFVGIARPAQNLETMSEGNLDNGEKFHDRKENDDFERSETEEVISKLSMKYDFIVTYTFSDYERDCRNQKEKDEIVSKQSLPKIVKEDEKGLCKPSELLNYAKDIVKTFSKDFSTINVSPDGHFWFVKVYNGLAYFVATTIDYPLYLGAEVVDVLSNVITSNEGKKSSEKQNIENKTLSQKLSSSFNQLFDKKKNVKESEEDLVLYSETDNSKLCDSNGPRHSLSGKNTHQNDEKRKDVDDSLLSEGIQSTDHLTTKQNNDGCSSKKSCNLPESKCDDLKTQQPPSIQGNKISEIQNKMLALSQSFRAAWKEKIEKNSNRTKETEIATSKDTSGNHVDIQLSIDEYCKVVFAWYIFVSKESAAYESHSLVIDIMYKMNSNIRRLLSTECQKNQAKFDVRVGLQMKKLTESEKIVRELLSQSKIFKNRTKSIRNKKAENIANFGKIAAVGSLAVFGIGGLILAGPEVAVISMIAGEVIETSALAAACTAWYKTTEHAAMKCWFWSQEFVPTSSDN